MVSSLKMPFHSLAAAALTILISYSDGFAWEERSSTDRMSDKVTRYFEVRAQGARYIAHLVAFCETRGTASAPTMFVSFPVRAGVNTINGRYRFDDDTAISRSFSLTSGGTGLWLSENNQLSTGALVLRAMRAGRLLVEVERWDGKDVMEFSLAGLPDVLKRLQCK
jgi:hypothetical protein